MKIAAVGDIHGRKIWKEIVEDAIKKVDKIVLLGDYIDPYPIEDELESKNIKNWNSFINEEYIHGEEDMPDEEYLTKKYGVTPDWQPGDEDLSDEEYYNKYYNKGKKSKLEQPKSKKQKIQEPVIEPADTLPWEDGDELLSDEEYIQKYFKHLQTIWRYPSFEETMSTLEQIVDFKRKNMDKVILIIGNHDAHYLFDEIYPCSRYDKQNSTKYKSFYKKNKDLFQYAYQCGNNLFTHAGVSNNWIDFFDATLESHGLKKDRSNLGDVLNSMANNKLSNKILNVVGAERGGSCLYGGPTWAHLTETHRDYLEGFNQYVGHSKVNYIWTSRIPKLKGSITYCDMLENPSTNIAWNYKIVHC